MQTKKNDLGEWGAHAFGVADCLFSPLLISHVSPPVDFAGIRRGYTAVSEILAQLIPQTFFAVIFRSKITELIPAPISAVLFTSFHAGQITGQKNSPVPKLPNAFGSELFAVIFRSKITELISQGQFLRPVFILVTIVGPIQRHWGEFGGVA